MTHTTTMMIFMCLARSSFPAKATAWSLPGVTRSSTLLGRQRLQSSTKHSWWNCRGGSGDSDTSFSTRLYSTRSDATNIPPVPFSSHELREAFTHNLPVQQLGGLTYWNTSALTVDGTASNRFRVVFVLGGPGAGTFSFHLFDCLFVSCAVALLIRMDSMQAHVFDSLSSPFILLPLICLSEHSVLILPLSVELHFYSFFFTILGKGTQCALLAEHYPVVHLSVGELLRQEQANPDSPNGALIRQTLVSGGIVPVEISIRLLQHAMQAAVEQWGTQVIYCVDGFPRNLDNLQGWCRYGYPQCMVWGILVYHCPLDVLEVRILERAKSSGRSDDNLASLQRRFTTFETETEPVIGMLRQQSETTHPPSFSVVDIRGDQSLEDVWLKTQHVFNQLILHDVLTANAALLQAVEQGDCDTYARLCCNYMREDKDALQFMHAMECPPSTDTLVSSSITNAQCDIISGKQVAVSYDRVLQGQVVREKRIWSHKGPSGWCNVHFSRIPQAVAVEETTSAPSMS
jgi:UMP-CMP kinase